ncbi:hypothetical protein Pelo_14746 [Pelomyxa schiedti]|nr:hypothetical protein Pelo_14746 [Pelomyxa schiedti]
MCHSVRFKFTKYHLAPFGNRSTIKPREQQPLLAAQQKGLLTSRLPLYGTDECKFAKGGITSLWTWGGGGTGSSHPSVFDEAMEAYLFCLREFWSFCALHEESFYYVLAKIEGDKIQWKAGSPPVSIRIQGNTEEKWTMALRCILGLLDKILALLPVLHTKIGSKTHPHASNTAQAPTSGTSTATVSGTGTGTVTSTGTGLVTPPLSKVPSPPPGPTGFSTSPPNSIINSLLSSSIIPPRPDFVNPPPVSPRKL